jgi:ubiquinone/menaquinone biosynthesis C-methylase UbiE
MIKNLIAKFLKKRSIVVVERIKPYIEKSNKLVDIGSGTGDIAYLLKSMGKDVTAVDVSDFHGPRLVAPIIYDGKKLPFKDKSFDTALLLMVLHHTPDPSIVFSEAARVAREVVIKIFVLTLLGIHIKQMRGGRIFLIAGDLKLLIQKKYQDRNFGFPFLHIAYHLIRK